jgi:hypothetical protein
MKNLTSNPFYGPHHDSVTQGFQHFSCVLVLVPERVRLPKFQVPAAARSIDVRRTTSQPVWLLIQGTAGNGQTAYPEKTGNYRNSLLVDFARVIRTHLGIAALHGHFFAHGFVFASLLNGILDRLFTAALVVAMGWAFKSISHFGSF